MSRITSDLVRGLGMIERAMERKQIAAVTTQISDYTLRRWQEYAEVILSDLPREYVLAAAKPLKRGIDAALEEASEPKITTEEVER